MSGISNAVRQIDERNVAIVFKIICVAVALVRIETHVGIMREKERSSAADADIEFGPFIDMPILVTVPSAGTRPPCSIRRGSF